MRIMVSAFLIGAAAMLTGCPPRDSATISSAEIKQLSDADLARRLLGASAAPFTHAMRTDQHEVPMVIFATDPVPSEEADLCQVSQLWVQFKKVPGDRYAVISLGTETSFLVPQTSMRAPEALKLNDDWALRKKACAAQGPVIVQNRLSPKIFKVWGDLAAGGKGKNAGLAMRTLQAARAAFAAKTLPTASCHDAVTDRKTAICADPNATVGAALARNPSGQQLTIDRCTDDPGRACINLSDWPNELGANTVVSIKTDAKSLNYLPEEAAITGIAITRDPAIVE